MMNKSDLKNWTRDMLESEIINMNAKNFQIQNEVNNLIEYNGRLKSQIESLKIQLNELEDKYKITKRELEELKSKCLKQKSGKGNIKDSDEEIDSLMILALMFNYLQNLSLSVPLEGHGYYYKYSGEKCNRQVHFTEGVGLHDGTGLEVELR